MTVLPATMGITKVHLILVQGVIPRITMELPIQATLRPSSQPIVLPATAKRPGLHLRLITILFTP